MNISKKQNIQVEAILKNDEYLLVENRTNISSVKDDDKLLEDIINYLSSDIEFTNELYENALKFIRGNKISTSRMEETQEDS